MSLSEQKKEKVDKKYRKLKLDVDFLEACIRHDVTPKFVQFKLVNLNLRNSSTYRDCQQRLLNEELNNKKEELNDSKHELSNLYENLYSEISFLDLKHIHTVITNGNEKTINTIKSTQNKKLEKLIIDYNNNKGTGKIIYNFSTHVLTDPQKSLLSKGLNFSIPQKYLRYENYLLPFELLFRDINRSKEMDEGNEIFFKTKLKDTCLTSFKLYNKTKHTVETSVKMNIMLFWN